MKKTIKIITASIVAALLIFFPKIANASSSDNQSNSIIKFTGDIYVNPDTSVNGDVVTVRGNIYVNGTVTGDVVTVFGNITVNGKVLGDAVAVNGKINLGPNGKIFGDMVEVFDRSRVMNHDYRFNYKPFIGLNVLGRVGKLIFSLLFTVIILLLALIVYAIMPFKISEMADTIDNNLGKRLGIGFLALIGLPIALIVLSILLAITIIGIIVIPFLWLAYIVSMLIAVVPVYVFVGAKVGELVSKQKSTGYAALSAGILSIWLIKSIIGFGGSYTNWISAIISLLVYILGIGTLLDYIFTRKKPKPEYGAHSPYPHQGGGSGGDSYGDGNSSEGLDH